MKTERQLDHILEDHVSHITPDEWRRVSRHVTKLSDEYGKLKVALTAIANWSHPYTEETAYCMADVADGALPLEDPNLPQREPFQQGLSHEQIHDPT